MSAEQGNAGNANGANLEDAGKELVAGLSAAERAGIVNVLKDKLNLLSGQNSGYIDTLSPKVKRRVSTLQELQKQHDEIEAKFREEKAALEAKYQKLYAPFYAKRLDIVTGVVDVEENKAEAEKQPEAKTEAETAPEAEKGIPEFWLTALKTNEVLSEQVTERDEQALKYLKDIKSCNLENPKGFRLDFYFDDNPYFKNSVLSKTYHMVDDDEPILEHCIGTEIEWLPGKNLTKKTMKKKPKKGAKNAKPVTKTEQCDSFFNFFTPPQLPESDDDIDTEEAEQLQELMEQDYDVGSTIKDKIIPHAVSWFTGEALQGEDYDDLEDDDGDDEEEGDDEEDEDEEDEDDDDDDESDDDESPAPRQTAPRSKASQKKAGNEPPECKQQ